MAQVTVRYVGTKEGGERAFKELTGFEWFPGDENKVDVEHARQMLRHGDIFEQAAGKAVKPAPAEVRLQRVAPDDMTADDEAMDREEAARKASTGG